MTFARELKWRQVAVVAGCFLNHVVCWGSAWGSGVFQMIFMEEFGKEGGSAALVSVVPTLIPAVMSFAGPLASALTNRLGCQWVVAIGTILVALGYALSAAANSLPVLCLTFASIGAGAGIVYIPSIVVLTQHFDQRLPIAVGFGSSGLGVGVFLFPPLIRWLESTFSWRVAVLCIAAFALLMLLSALAFKPPPINVPRQLSTVSTASSRRRKTLRVKMMRQPPFLCLLLTYVLFFYGTVGLYVHLPSHVRELGFDKDQAAMFPSAAGMATLVSKALSGFLAQRSATPTALLASSMACGGLSVVAVALLSSHAGLILACVAFGLCSGTLGPFLPLLIRELVGKEGVGDGYGYVMVAEGLGSLLGPPMAGALHDLSQSYKVSLCAAGGSLLAASLVMLYPLSRAWPRSRPPQVILSALGGGSLEVPFSIPPGESGVELIASATEESLKDPDGLSVQDETLTHSDGGERESIAKS